MMEIAFHPEASADLIAAIAYFNGQREGLGDEFLFEVEEASERIATTPSMFPKSTDQGHRKCFVKRFPYTLHFLAENDMICVMAVAHKSRDPNYWRHRLTVDRAGPPAA